MAYRSLSHVLVDNATYPHFFFGFCISPITPGTAKMMTSEILTRGWDLHTFIRVAPLPSPLRLRHYGFILFRIPIYCIFAICRISFFTYDSFAVPSPVRARSQGTLGGGGECMGLPPPIPLMRDRDHNDGLFSVLA